MDAVAKSETRNWSQRVSIRFSLGMDYERAVIIVRWNGRTTVSREEFSCANGVQVEI